MPDIDPRDFGVCPKCGWPDLWPTWKPHGDQWDCWGGWRALREVPHRGEHFHVECRRCGYVMSVDATLEATDA